MPQIFQLARIDVSTVREPRSTFRIAVKLNALRSEIEDVVYSCKIDVLPEQRKLCNPCQIILCDRVLSEVFLYRTLQRRILPLDRFILGGLRVGGSRTARIRAVLEHAGPDKEQEHNKSRYGSDKHPIRVFFLSVLL